MRNEEEITRRREREREGIMSVDWEIRKLSCSYVEVGSWYEGTKVKWRFSYCGAKQGR